MRKLILTVALLFTYFLFPGNAELHAWPWDSDYLVRIDQVDYTSDDFKNWWENYREESIPFPENPDLFIDWLLLSREAEAMELYKEEDFIRKVGVFLKVRALMALKHEEIDLKIVVSEEEIKKQYEQEYLPIWKVHLLYFQDQQQAQKNYTGLHEGTINIASFKEKKKADSVQVHYEERMFRPVVLKAFADWYGKISSLKEGEVATPFAFNNKFVVIQLVGQIAAAENDFTTVKERIKKELVQQRTLEVNTKFFDQLFKKFEVRIDEKLLKEISFGITAEAELDKNLISTNRQNVTVREFLAQLARERNRFGRKHETPEEIEKLKRGVLNGIVYQSLSSWESLDRHYEKKSPLKEIFQFYQQNRLIKELEKKVFQKKAKVTKDDVEKYYQQHLEEFTVPEQVKFAIWEGEEGNSRKIEEALARGEDFFNVTAKYFAHRVPIQEKAITKLNKILQQQISGLAKGAVSKPFAMQNRSAIILLVDRQKGNARPLSQVYQQIEKKLTEDKYTAARGQYLTILKNRSKIKVDAGEWRRLQKELGG